MNKRIKKLLAVASVAVLAFTGCSKKEDGFDSQNDQDKLQTEEFQEESSENLIDTLSTNIVYKNHSEFVKETKNITSQFSNWLTSHNIENQISLDGYSVENTNTEFEENNIKYKRNVFLDTPSNEKYRVSLVYENHIQEAYSKDNEFIKLTYDVVKKYNEDMSIDDFVSELNAYVNKEISTLSFNNEIVKISISNRNTTKQLSMEFDRKIEDTTEEYPKKEYATVKDFIDDSNELSKKIKEKADKISSMDKNIFNVNGKEVYRNVSKSIYMTANINGKLYQRINISIGMYGGSESGMSFNDDALELVYSTLEDVYGEELKNYYTLEDFKNIAKSNTRLMHSSDDTQSIKNTNLKMPYLSNGVLSISNTLGSKDYIKSDLSYNYYGTPEAKSTLESLEDAVQSNGNIRFEINIPVVAEGISEYRPEYKNGDYILDDGTVVKEIDSRY